MHNPRPIVFGVDKVGLFSSDFTSLSCRVVASRGLDWTGGGSNEVRSFACCVVGLIRVSLRSEMSVSLRFLDLQKRQRHRSGAQADFLDGEDAREEM